MFKKSSCMRQSNYSNPDESKKKVNHGTKSALFDDDEVGDEGESDQDDYLEEWLDPAEELRFKSLAQRANTSSSTSTDYGKTYQQNKPRKRRSNDTWSDDKELDMLESYYKVIKTKSNIKKNTQIYSDVLKDLESKGYSDLSTDSIKNKYNQLWNNFKVSWDNNNTTGQKPRYSPHYDFFEEIHCEKPNVTPIFACSSIKPNIHTTNALDGDKKCKKSESEEHRKENSKSTQEPINVQRTKKRKVVSSDEEVKNLKEEIKGKPKIKKTRADFEDRYMEYMERRDEKMFTALKDSSNVVADCFTKVCNLLSNNS